MERRALVVGDGVAGLTCAYLLARLGWQIELQGEAAESRRAWVLDPVTHHLLRQLWDATSDGSDLLAAAVKVAGRRVRWGGAPPAWIDLPAWIVRAGAVTSRLRERLFRDAGERVSFHATCRKARAEPAKPPIAGTPWVIDASGRGGSIARRHPIQRQVFGERCISVAEVDLVQPLAETRMESLQGGWIFLAPLPPEPTPTAAARSRRPNGVLQVMLPTSREFERKAELLLCSSQDIGPILTSPPDRWRTFTAAPAILDVPCGSGWIAIGDAALSLDPLAGDGIGSALRSAVLAVAVLDGIAGGAPANDLLDHYTRRLREAFITHLARCVDFYRAAESPATTKAQSSWNEELRAARSARRHLADDARFSAGGSSAAHFAYRLEGLHLAPFSE